MALPLIVPLLLAGTAAWALLSKPSTAANPPTASTPPAGSPPITSTGPEPSMNDFRRGFSDLVKQSLEDPLSLNVPALEELRDVLVTNGMADEGKTIAGILDKIAFAKSSPPPTFNPLGIRSAAELYQFVDRVKAHKDMTDTRVLDGMARFLDQEGHSDWAHTLSYLAASIRLERVSAGRPSDPSTPPQSLPAISADSADNVPSTAAIRGLVAPTLRQQISFYLGMAHPPLTDLKAAADMAARIGDADLAKRAHDQWLFLVKQI